MKNLLAALYFLLFLVPPGANTLCAQTPVDLKGFNGKNGVKATADARALTVSWPVGATAKAQLVLNLDSLQPLIRSVGVSEGASFKTIARQLDPVFILSVGKRDLVSQNGWNIFFDKVPNKPFTTNTVTLEKQFINVNSQGSRTIITIGSLKSPDFAGNMEITLYNGSALMNIAAVVATARDSTAILYDAGLVTKQKQWDRISYTDVTGKIQAVKPAMDDSSRNQAVKYRTVTAQSTTGTVAVFPAPHQYFYPLDEAFNLQFTWFGNHYRNLTDGYGLGIRQDLYGDKRFVPWFNAPPYTKQRLNFFVLLHGGTPALAMEEVKKFTHRDKYVALPGYKTLASHFHNEFIMKVALAGKPIPDTPSFVKVFKQTGIDIVHLGEFHYTAHPKGPDTTRLKELDELFKQCRRLSSNNFLLLPGEEPNEFFGGHWLQLFPKPVYWIMSRKPDQPFESRHPVYGTVYRIGNAAEMQQLLDKEQGLAWTAHPRTKGSTGYPDKYKAEPFFTSDRFIGGAWKAMPADLSEPRLGIRVLDLLDDMSNWGMHKKILAEADLFTIEPENEMYAHLNVNYVKLSRLPKFDEGWHPVTEAVQRGRFFSSTGEVLIPSFTVNGKEAGDTLSISGGSAKVNVEFSLNWTFPLNFAEIVTGDGNIVHRHAVFLHETLPFGQHTFKIPIDLSNMKWVRLEVWDAAANGAFTQTVWLQ